MDVKLNRIYQGRVCSANWLLGKGKKLEASEAKDWETALWDHHKIFQAAANYYLVALAALAGKDHPQLGGMFSQLDQAWSNDRGKGGRRLTIMRNQVAPFLGLDPQKATLEEAFAAVLEGNDASDETRALALSLLLSKAQGDSGIQQNGRGYWPRFCNPKANPTWDFSASALAATQGGERLQRAVHGLLTDGERQALADEMDLSWTVKIDPVKVRKGDEAKAKLNEAVTFFEKSLIQDPDATRHGRWLVSQKANATAAWAEIKEAIASLPEEFSVPVNRKAAPERTYATLLFKHFPSGFTQGLLAELLGEPKAANQKKAAPKDGEDFARLGDDPIKLGRGERGYVFPAFSALPRWAKDEGVAVAWSEFDIAAFKEALKTFNQFRLKTEERTAERLKLQARRAYMLGEIPKWSGKDDEGDEPARLAGDPRFEAALLLEHDEKLKGWDENPEAAYRFSQRALRGLDHLMEKWRKIVLPGEAWSEKKRALLKESLTEHQTERALSMGSAGLFERLIEDPKYWCLWQAPTTDEAAEQLKKKWADDIIESFSEFQELRDELDDPDSRINRPIRLTAADPEHSRRLFMFSDLAGGSKHVHVKGKSVVDVSLVVDEQGSLKERRVRLHYSAPRLRRDGVAGDTSRWLPPMLQAMMPEDEAPEQDFSKCAVALMPQPSRKEGGDVRFLLNFPLTLDVTKVVGSLGKLEMWQRQFNGKDKEWLHLHWPDTRADKSEDKSKDKAWWNNCQQFRLLSIDLGQRVAAASARLEACQGDGFWRLGEIDGKPWSAKLEGMKHLRLPGEGAMEWDGKAFREERFGENGRKADSIDLTQAEEILSLLGMGGGRLSHDLEEIEFFPAQNWFLLRAMRRGQGRLAKFQGWLYDLGAGDEDRREKALEQMNTRPEKVTETNADNAVFDELRKQGDEGKAVFLEEQIHAWREALPQVLTILANRIAPWRDQVWEWGQHPTDPRDAEERPNHLLAATKGLRKQKKRWGQGGLSMRRLEQLEELRKRCQSLNRALQRKVGDQAVFGRQSESMESPDPCPELLGKLDRLREQRVDQTAHLILAEALGVQLKKPEKEADERRRLDIHGEYEKVREPVDFIVLEDLMRYRTTQGRAPSENSRLMKWCHRAITNKLIELAEPFGIQVIQAPAAYSSRFCSRTGMPGFRAEEVGPADAKRWPWCRWLEQFKLPDDPRERKQHSSPTERAREAKKLFDKVALANPDWPLHPAKQRRLLVPKAGGPVFVSITGKAPPMDADLNAAINLGLRAIASPQAAHLLHKFRSEPAGAGQLKPKNVNKREVALFGKGKSVKPFATVEGGIEGRQPNLFYCPDGVLGKECCRHERLPNVNLLPGKALWGLVKVKQHERCDALNAGNVLSESLD